MSAQPEQRISFEEYIALEEGTSIKHEYIDGYAYAMTGAMPQHNKIVANCNGVLYQKLTHHSCDVYSSDQRVKVEAANAYFYPDLSVFCGELEYDHRRRDTLTNPIMIVEVRSPSTQAYDRGFKFEYYRKLPSLQAYMLVAQDRPYVELWLRQAEDRSLFIEFHSLENMAHIPPLDISITQAEIYRRVEFPTS